MSRKNLKSQSAMEYLTTYAWAILIISVVLVALYQLGLFSQSTSNTALPGSCQVLRPGGPLSKFNMQLAGLCNGLPPQFAGVFSGSGYISIGNTNALNSLSSITVSAWVNSPLGGSGGNWYNIVSKGTWQTPNFDTIIRQDGVYLGLSIGTVGYEPVVSISKNNWHFIVYESSSSNFYFSVDGGSFITQAETVSFPGSTNSLIIGSGDNGNAGVYNFVGEMANVQIYNTTLSGPEANALYKEGIGGAPLVLQNLVGWWPLNGNPNDYSGDNLTGVNNGVTFTSAWTSGYTTP